MGDAVLQVDEAVLQVDNSCLRSVARCSTEAVLRYAWGWTTVEEHAALLAGSAVHAALDVFLDPRLGARVDAALAAFDREYRDWSRANVASGDRLAYENVRTILVTWLRSHPPERLPFVVEATELGFRVPLTEGIDFVGRLDGLVRSRLDGRRWLLEHKTTGRLTGYWTQQWQWDSQLTGYVYGAEQATGETVVGVYVNGIELAKLPSDASRKCREHGVKYAECGDQHGKAEITPVMRTPEQVKVWRMDAIGLATRFASLREHYPTVKELKHVPMEGTFNKSCQWCSYRDFCASGRQERNVNLMLVKQPWEPLAGTTVLEPKGATDAG